MSAGSNQTITLPAGVNLNGTVSDDGYPASSIVATTWTKLSGPGTVSFGNISDPLTGATFSVAGTYVLQLSATDSALTTNSTMLAATRISRG